MSLRCWYARSTGGRWNGSWKDFHLGGSGNALQIGDWESCNVVATVQFMGEYLWRVGDFVAQRLSWHCEWRTGAVSAPEIEFCAPPPVGNPVNTTPWASSTDLIPWTNPGGNNARSGWDLEKCYRWDDTWNRFETRQLIAHRKCESDPQGSEHQCWRARKPMDYPPCFVWYLNIQSKTIK